MCFACGDFQYSRSDLLHSAVALGAPKSKTVKDYTALLTGRSWVSHETLKTTKSPVFLTYSFPLKINKRDKIGDPEGADSWRAFSRFDQQDAKAALKQWGDACGIKFIEVKNQKGDIQSNWWNTGSFNSGVGYQPSVYSAYPDKPNYYSYFNEGGGDIYLNNSLDESFATNLKFKKYILLHEVGHALGFKHTFDSSQSLNPIVLEEAYDTTDYSVMSYTYKTPPTKLGPFDKQAAKALYGSPKMDGRQTSKWSWNAKAETLTQIGKATNDTLRGTSVKDVIKGVAGDDLIQGFFGNDTLYGGFGNDVLIGGPGRDVFVFDASLDDTSNVDIIYDFVAKEDKLRLSQTVFEAVGPKGQLASDAFVIADKAQDASDRIIYHDGYTGDLFYDPDGTGPLQQIKFAKLSIYTGLKASHFLII